MLFYRVGEYFEDRAVDRSLSRSWTRSTCVGGKSGQKDNGEIEVIPAEDAQEGDIVLCAWATRVPLDGARLSKAKAVRIPRAVTGEPVPVRVAAGDRATPAVSKTPTVRSNCVSPLHSR